MEIVRTEVRKERRKGRGENIWKEKLRERIKEGDERTRERGREIMRMREADMHNRIREAEKGHQLLHRYTLELMKEKMK